MPSTQCPRHGEQEAASVCRHIAESLDSGKAVGFHWSSSSTSRRPDAWCSKCNHLMMTSGEDWTPEVLAVAQVNLLCAKCYDAARSIWSSAPH